MTDTPNVTFVNAARLWVAFRKDHARCTRGGGCECEGGVVPELDRSRVLHRVAAELRGRLADQRVAVRIPPRDGRAALLELRNRVDPWRPSTRGAPPSVGRWARDEGAGTRSYGEAPGSGDWRTVATAFRR